MQKKKYFILLFWGISAWFTFCPAQNIDSLLVEFDRNTEKPQRKQIEKTIHLLNKQKIARPAIVFSSQTDTKWLLATTYYTGAEYLHNQSEFARSILFSQKSLNYFKALKDTAGLCKVYDMLCSTEHRLGNISKAIEYAAENIELARKQNNNEELSTALHNMALLNLLNNQAALSLELEQKALAIEKKLNNKDKIAIRYGGLGEIYLGLKQHANAIKSLHSAIDIEKELGKNSKVAMRQSVLGDVYFDLNQLDSAIYYYTRAFNTLRKHNMLASICICANQLGRIYNKKGDYERAVLYSEEALKISKEIGYKHMEQRSYELLSSIHTYRNPFLALQYFKKSSELKDSLYSEQSKEQIERFRSQYETYTKEAEIALQKEQLAKQKILRYALFIVLVLMTGIAIVLTRLNAIKKKRNQNLIELNATKDKFFSIISHDLKNPAIAQKLSLEMLSKHFQELSHQDLKQQLNENYKAAEAQVNLLLQLLDWRKLNLDNFHCEPTSFSIQTVIEETLALLEKSAKNKDITFENTPTNPAVFADRNMVTTILRNIISNAIKFSYRGGKININIEEVREKAYISVSDNGVGMTQETIDRIFTLTSHSQRGTDGETGTGLGLIICKNLIERNNGTLLIASDLQKEITTISFTLPLATENRL